MVQAWGNGGIVLASVAAFATTLVLGSQEVSSWGWRIPFWFGGALALGVFWLRRNLPETLATAERSAGTRIVWRNMGRHRWALVATILMIGGTQVVTYCWLAGLPAAAKAIFGQSGTVVFGMTTLLSVLVLIFCPVIGVIADRFGLGPTFVWSRLISIPFLFLMMLYARPSESTFALVMLVGAVLLPFALSFIDAVVAAMMPTGVRVTGVGLGFSLGVSLFGGTAPYIMVWLSSKGIFWAFPTYAGTLLLISVLFYFVALKKTGMYIDGYLKGALRPRSSEAGGGVPSLEMKP